MLLPGASYWTFPGYLKSLTGAVPNQDRITMQGVIRVTGAPTFTTA
jgi:hypothetical protein